MKAVLKNKIQFSAIKVLNKELKFHELLKVLTLLINQQKKNEPWRSFSEPKDNKEKESRELIGDAILLYRALMSIFNKEQAEIIVRKVITDSAITQLKYLIPKIKKGKVLGMSEEKRTRYFTDIIEKFPNSDYIKKDTPKNEFGFDITRCRLVELICQAGHPELSDAFCNGDGIFFEKCQKDIVFSRNEMIGKGNEICDFSFKIRD